MTLSSQPASRSRAPYSLMPERGGHRLAPAVEREQEDVVVEVGHGRAAVGAAEVDVHGLVEGHEQTALAAAIEVVLLLEPLAGPELLEDRLHLLAQRAGDGVEPEAPEVREPAGLVVLD